MVHHSASGTAFQMQPVGWTPEILLCEADDGLQDAFRLMLEDLASVRKKTEALLLVPR